MEFDRSYPNWWGSCSYCICLKSSSLTSCSLRHLGSARSRYSTVSPRTSSIFLLYRNWRSYSRAFEIATVTGYHLAPAQLSLLPLSIFPTGLLYFLPLWWKFIVCFTPPLTTRTVGRMRGNSSAPIAVVATYIPLSAERRNYSLITRTITRWQGLTNQKETSGTRARLTAFGTCTIHIEYFHHPFASTALSAGVHNPRSYKRKKIHRGVNDRNDRTVKRQQKNTIKPLELGPCILLLRCLIGPSFWIPPLKR